jgi:hypothetical protein
MFEGMAEKPSWRPVKSESDDKAECKFDAGALPSSGTELEPVAWFNGSDATGAMGESGSVDSTFTLASCARLWLAGRG